MTTELFYLWMSGLVLIIATLIQQLTSLFNVGLMPVLGSREDVKFTGITGRLERAILNSIIAMTLITPAIVILHLMEITNDSTVLAVQIFLTARIVYVISYGLGIMGLRSAGWIASLLSILWLYYSAI